MIWLSLPLGLLSWAVPIMFHKKKPASVSAVSFGLCGLALLNVLWQLFRWITADAYGTFDDFTDSLLLCSVTLVFGTVLLNLRLYLPKRIPPRMIRTRTFWVVLLLQTAAFVLPAIYILCVGAEPSSLAQILYFDLMLGLAILLIALYLSKTKAENLSFGVPLAVAVFPLLYHVILIQTIFRIFGLLLVIDLSMFRMIYYFPVLVMSSIGIGILKLQHRLRKKHDTEKGEPHESE